MTSAPVCKRYRARARPTPSDGWSAESAHGLAPFPCRRSAEMNRPFLRGGDPACEAAAHLPHSRPADRRATTRLAEGKNAVHVKEALGHSDLRTTTGYTHLAREHLRSLVDDDPGRERLKELTA